ncbi:uncharacterized protein LOC106175958 [Lingula anatina]|uniref:Uncharacterized protein LOC106175958 n=1 Tax=Lingula anatina TaxID=7574 RepID=A0A1S3JU53_LINAN|nr:uncharacterized protein LOC106175958 [Lingula anatina]|eukprot:XP_013413614.1 uncharacterized protein LOC106175958 [Lingula anatina]
MGHSTSIFAAVLGAAGTAASILTAGKLTVLLAVSAALGASGKITVSGSTIAHSVLSASAQAEANEVLQKDHSALRDILVLLETLKHISKQDVMEIKQHFEVRNTANIPEKCIILSTMHHTGKIGFIVGSKILYKPIMSARKLVEELNAMDTGPRLATPGNENLPQLLLEAMGIKVPRYVLDSASGTIPLVFLPHDIWGLVEAAAIVASDRGTEITELLQSTAEALEKEIPSQQDFDILVNKFISNI